MFYLKSTSLIDWEVTNKQVFLAFMIIFYQSLHFWFATNLGLLIIFSVKLYSSFDLLFN